jgi:hypothetical protein
MYKTYLLVAFLCIVSFGTGLIAAFSFLTPPQLSLENQANWVLIRSFRGVLDPSEGIVTANVYVISYPSTGLDPHEVFQNRIDVMSSRGTATFSWPTIKEYAAGWCEIVDVDGDTHREFLLFHGVRALRIVSYSSGVFTFREDRDEVHSLRGNLQLLDVDDDGRFEFVDDESIEAATVAPGASVEPGIRQWDRPRGFYDAPDSVLARYKNVLR